MHLCALVLQVGIMVNTRISGKIIVVDIKMINYEYIMRIVAMNMHPERIAQTADKR